MKAVRAVNGETGGRRRVPRAIVVILVMLVCLALLVVVSGFYVKGIKTVYPNVSIAGVDVSGMTYDGALTALISAGYNENAAGVSVDIGFPNGLRMVITGKEAGFSLDAGEAARLAVNYGKSGSFLASEISFIKSLLSRTDLTHNELAEIDEVYVKGVVAEYTKKFNESLMSDTFTIADDHIEVVKNVGVKLASVDDIYAVTEALLYEALEERDSLSTEYTPSGSDIGGDIDLLALYDTINVEPVPAVYDPETVSVSESIVGVSFDMDSARRALDAAGSGQRIIIPLIFTEPDVTSEQLSSLLFRDILSEKMTYIDGTSNRLNNVTISAEAINGFILNPGETFSFNEVVGIRTAARGYKEAGAYVGGKTVQEIGGGICQTSSTLYYCVLYADLIVAERKCHMFTIPYLPLGHDATISWGAIDFKFKNDTDYPIRIETNVDGRDLTIKLVGTKLDGNYVKMEYVKLSTTPYETIQKEDESIEPGKTKEDTGGHTGAVVETYKSIFDKDGNLLSRTFVAKSSYRKQDRVILVPVGTLEPKETSPTDAPPTDTPTEEPTPSENPPVESPTPVDPTPSETPIETPPQVAIPEE